MFPYAGHICASLTNESGHIIGDLSFRPDNNQPKLADTQTILHRQIYEPRSGSVRRSSFIRFATEVFEACRVIELDGKNPLYLSIITGTEITDKLWKLRDIFKKIKDADSSFYLAVYNLCTSFISNYELEKIEQLNEPQIQKNISDLIEKAESLISTKGINPEGRRRIAAQACGHALAKAFLNDTHALEKQFGADLTTQHYAAHIIASIIGDNNYLNVTSLLDDIAAAIHELASENSNNRYKP